MSDENKRVSRAFTEYFSTGSAALADEVLDPDVVFHGPAGIGELNGLDAVKGMVTGFREGFPDERSTVVDQVAEGDKVVTRWRARGTHDGEFNGLAATNREFAALADAPGLLLLAGDGSLISTTAAGEMWLAELGHPDPMRHGLPGEIFMLAAKFIAGDASTPARLQMRTRAGRWAVLHASRLPAPGNDAVAVIIEEPSPAELAPVLMMAYGLTKQERTLTALVCRGLSTAQIAGRLHITPNTIQDHLKSIFEKTGVGSRRELVATILQEQYLPRMMAGRPPGPSGSFMAW